MSDPEALRSLERELDRVVDRLNAMPLARVEPIAPDCRRAATVMVEHTRRLADDIPDDATVPDLRPHGLGAVLAVLGHDYLAAARASSAADVDPVLDALVELRRALP